MDKKAEHVGTGVVTTLLKVDAWASSIQSDSPAAASISLCGSTACDVIDQLAQALVDDATGIEGLLLSKSLQETFFYCVGFDPDLTVSEITSRVKGFINRWGKGALIQQFLYLFFFNQLLAQSGWTHAVAYDMKSAARICRRAVMAANPPQELVDRSTAETLIHNIQAGLSRYVKAAG